MLLLAFLVVVLDRILGYTPLIVSGMARVYPKVFMRNCTLLILYGRMLSRGVCRNFSMGVETFLYERENLGGGCDFFLKNPSKLKKFPKKGGLTPKPFLNTILMLSYLNVAKWYV